MEVKALEGFKRYKPTLNFLSKKEFSQLKNGKTVKIKQVVAEALIGMGWVKKASVLKVKKEGK